ncbi:hypothetical protein E2C01_010814 [Portunus trituberculatus]|uniref:Uncharacterized protein n=1 Tax=Portunus trituberculatus TaxID=210409 RepID=A0A5B7D9F3_PORTR|nr:hypothetical protein [Portunus trituberculatus]
MYTLTCCRSCATFFLALRAPRLVARHLALDIMVAEGGARGQRLAMSTSEIKSSELVPWGNVWLSRQRLQQIKQ